MSVCRRRHAVHGDLDAMPDPDDPPRLLEARGPDVVGRGDTDPAPP